MIKVVFMGIQGSGKGTQARLLSSHLGIEHVNVGQILRNHIKQNTELGKVFKTYIEKGEFVPDKYIIDMFEKDDHINNPLGVVLDGFPRNLVQAQFLMDGFHVHHVFLFELESEDIAIERISSRRICSACAADYNLLSKKPKVEDTCDLCGGKLIQRADDTVEAIQKRLTLYHNRTAPLAAYFEEKGILSKINANHSPEEIHKQILQILHIDPNTPFYDKKK